MVSEAKGIMYVPVWVDGGVIKALVLDTGAIPTTETDPITALDVTLQSTDITLKVSEQSPITDLPVRLYTYYNGSWQNAPTETDGSLHVSFRSQAQTLLIQQVMPSLIQPGMNAYVGGDWQKQPIMYGYSDRLHIKASHTQVGAGAYTMTICTVPPDVIYIVNAIISNNNARALKHTLQLCAGGDCMTVFEKTTTGAGELVLNGNLKYVLKEGDSVKVVFTTSQNGDYMVGRVWGTIMGIGL